MLLIMGVRWEGELTFPWICTHGGCFPKLVKWSEWLQMSIPKETLSAQRWKEHADVVGGDFFTQKYVPILSKIRVVFGGPFLKPSKPTFSGSTKTQCKYDDVIYQLIVAYLRPPRPSMQRGPCSLVLHLCVNIEFVHTIQELHHETDPEFYQCPALTFLGSPDHARTMSPASCWCTTSMSLDCWSSVDSLSRKDMNLWEKLHQYVVTFGDLI